MERKTFLRTSGIFAAGMYAAHARAIAGPFLPGEILHNIPVDKKLDPQWVKSLSARGTVTSYRKSKNELQFIGMPVGGIHTGTVYLGGDGRLWLWDIFNSNQEGIDPKTIEWDSAVHAGNKIRSRDGSAYVQPARNIRPLEQGFAFRIKIGGSIVVKKMEAADWDEIVFEASYPMAKLHYTDHTLPLTITADVYSPFIPLNEKDSGIPCTIYSFNISNNSGQPVEIAILGWLENKTAIHSIAPTDNRVNKIITSSGFTLVQCSLQTNGSETRIKEPDAGTLAIAAVKGQPVYQTDLQFPITAASFDPASAAPATKPAGERLIAAVTVSFSIAASATENAAIALAWHFPHLRLHKSIADSGRYYNNWFTSAAGVLQYVQQHFAELHSISHLWKQTWYDSSLPWWLLERTLMNISTLATTTAHRFESGRFYAWEGVGCCEGTCTHVWQYAQAMGRVFPSIEKDTRERIDLGLSLQADGMIWYRGEIVKGPAIDGQAGTILRIYREHQMSADDSFLRKNWNSIKLAAQWVINQDRNKDGMEDTPIENTLDAVWDGEIAWLVGLCIAAVKAAELMALEIQDEIFAVQCAAYVAKGRQNMETKLFNGEYFIHRPDEKTGRQKLGAYNTCHIDQVYGQSWAHQVGLGHIISKEKSMAALRALWKYNFTPDVGPYIKERKGGRPYALPGEGGLVMNTNPGNEAKPYGNNITWQMGYFHECMSGFEHQVAAHMMAEGMVNEALVITRMIHDRYHARKRNPFNEIECSDHYARAMASYGTFITACGFEYHGPKGYMRFAPRLHKQKFKAPFIAAEGWGSYEQEEQRQQFTAALVLRYGTLRLRTFGVDCDQHAKHITVLHNGQRLVHTFVQYDKKITIQLQDALLLQREQVVTITIV
jgi:non-lysosomal glucosylceramidase